jgi:glutamine amidotransferase-like uncharacterized protein
MMALLGKYSKILIILIIVFLIAVASFFAYIPGNKTNQNIGFLISLKNVDPENVTNAFKLVNRLLQNDFKVYLIDQENKLGSDLNLEPGDFIVPQQTSNLNPSSQELLNKYLKKEAQQLNVTVEEVEFSFNLSALSLKKPKIAIFEGGGVTGGVLEHLYPLEGANFDVQILNSTEIQNQALSNFSVLTFPGGGAYWNYLDEKTVSQIKDFVAKGGGFVGTCDGAAFGVDVGLLNAHKMTGALYPQYDEYADIRGPLTLKIVHEGLLTTGYNDSLRSVYFKGPFFDEVGKEVDVVAVLNSTTEETQTYFPEIVKAYNYSLNIDSLNRAWNTPALLSGAYGVGKVVLSSVHPEILPESQRLFINSMYFALSGEKEPVNSYVDKDGENKSGFGDNLTDIVFNEKTFSQAVDSIKLLKDDAQSAATVIEGSAKMNFELVGVIGDSLSMILNDICTRSTKAIIGLEDLKNKYYYLAHNKRNLKESTLCWMNAELLRETENLQKEIIHEVNVANTSVDLHRVMNQVSIALSEHVANIEKITFCKNETLRGEMTISLYNSEISTLAKLQTNANSLLLSLSTRIDSILIRLEFLEVAFSLYWH